MKPPRAMFATCTPRRTIVDVIKKCTERERAPVLERPSRETDARVDLVANHRGPVVRSVPGPAGGHRENAREGADELGVKVPRHLRTEHGGGCLPDAKRAPGCRLRSAADFVSRASVWQ
jgi:hypothetical protein